MDSYFDYVRLRKNIALIQQMILSLDSSALENEQLRLIELDLAEARLQLTEFEKRNNPNDVFFWETLRYLG